MKKLLFIIPSVLLLLAAGTLVFCKHHAERTGLAGDCHTYLLVCRAYGRMLYARNDHL